MVFIDCYLNISMKDNPASGRLLGLVMDSFGREAG